MAKFEYRFPELGEGLHEGEIIKMHIKAGDKVTDDDIVMEVQNDKAVVEVPCPVNGTVLEVFTKDGQVCRVGEVVAIIDAEGDIPEQEGGHPAEHASQEADAAKGGADTTSSPATSSPATGGATNFEYKFPELGEGLHEGKSSRCTSRLETKSLTTISLWKFRMIRQWWKFLLRSTVL